MLSRPICGAHRVEVGLGDPDARVGRIAGGLLAVEVGLATRSRGRPATALRSYSFWANAASARATWICAASCAAFCDWTERSMTASTWPWRTQLPASTSTAVTRPPSPATPTGWSRRAASAPDAVTTRATWLRPGTTTRHGRDLPALRRRPRPPPACSLSPPRMNMKRDRRGRRCRRRPR